MWPARLPGVQGYAERKLLLLCDVIGAAKAFHADAVRRERARQRPQVRRAAPGQAARTSHVVECDTGAGLGKASSHSQPCV